MPDRREELHEVLMSIKLPKGFYYLNLYGIIVHRETTPNGLTTNNLIVRIYKDIVIPPNMSLEQAKEFLKKELI